MSKCRIICTRTVRRLMRARIKPFPCSAAREKSNHKLILVTGKAKVNLTYGTFPLPWKG